MYFQRYVICLYQYYPIEISKTMEVFYIGIH